jgi:serine protease Do
MDEISNMMQYIPAGTTVDVTVAQAANDYEETTVQVTLTNKSQN